MFENALTLKNMSYGKKITCKAVVSAGLVALAVILPQLVHLALGAPGGVQWLPCICKDSPRRLQLVKIGLAGLLS